MSFFSFPPLSGEAFVPRPSGHHLVPSSQSLAQSEALYVAQADAVATYIPPRAPIGCKHDSSEPALHSIAPDLDDDDDDDDDDGEDEDDQDDNEADGEEEADDEVEDDGIVAGEGDEHGEAGGAQAASRAMFSLEELLRSALSMASWLRPESVVFVHGVDGEAVVQRIAGHTATVRMDEAGIDFAVPTASLTRAPVRVGDHCRSSELPGVGVLLDAVDSDLTVRVRTVPDMRVVRVRSASLYRVKPQVQQPPA